jgi:hypothetical protein
MGLSAFILRRRPRGYFSNIPAPVRRNNVLLMIETRQAIMYLLIKVVYLTG